MTEVNAEILDRLQVKDALLFGLSDTLDVKASIVLVVITFLGTLSGMFLSNPKLPELLRYGQLVTSGVLSVAGLMAFMALRPRKHAIETAEEFDGWEKELRAYYQDAVEPDQAVSNAFMVGRIERLKERILLNAKINSAKLAFLDRSYWLSAVALGLNLATLLWLAIISNHPF